MDHIGLFLLALFGLVFLLLAQFRELFRQIARTADDWRRMVEAWRKGDGDQ